MLVVRIEKHDPSLRAPEIGRTYIQPIGSMIDGKRDFEFFIRQKDHLYAYPEKMFQGSARHGVVTGFPVKGAPIWRLVNAGLSACYQDEGTVPGVVTSTNSDIGEQIAELRREVAMRERVFPSWLKNGNIKQEDANKRLRAMKGALRTMIEIHGSRYGE